MFHKGMFRGFSAWYKEERRIICISRRLCSVCSKRPAAEEAWSSTYHIILFITKWNKCVNINYRFHDEDCGCWETFAFLFPYLKVRTVTNEYFTINSPRCISRETACTIFQSELGIKFFILQCVLTENNNLSDFILGGCCETLTLLPKESNNNKIYSHEWLRRL